MKKILTVVLMLSSVLTSLIVSETKASETMDFEGSASSVAIYDHEIHPENIVSAPELFGIADLSLANLSPFAFVPLDQDANSKFENSGIERYCTAACWLLANVAIPSGARLVFLFIDATDWDNQGTVQARILQCATFSGGCIDLVTVATGVSETPGTIGLASIADQTILNGLNTYAVQLRITGGTSSTRIGGVKIAYLRQISPAPVSATFSDVPIDHLFFTEIEALSASGISGGCSSGKFCPDNPVTRGQMAAFLARALGLHWN